MSEDKKVEKSPARAYGESIFHAVAAKYIARKLAKTIADNGMDWDEAAEDATEGARSPGSKAVMLDAGNLLHLKMLFNDDFPHREAVYSALMPPIFDSGKLDDCIKAGEEGENDRKHIRRTLSVGVTLLDELLRVYTHELSHKAAGEHFGAKGEIAVIVMPEMRQVGEMGYGIALALTGGRCRFTDEPAMTPEQRAVVNVAGHMGEKLCTSIKGMGEEPARDAEYWLRRFQNIRDAGDPEKTKDPKVFHDGAYNDAMDFFKCAPTEAEQLAAIAQAGEIIIAGWADILASAAFRAIRHMDTMGSVMQLLTTAMDMAEAAAMGRYGEITLMTVPGEPEE